MRCSRAHASKLLFNVYGVYLNNTEPSFNCPAPYILLYPGSLLKARSTSRNRAKLGADSLYEDRGRMMIDLPDCGINHFIFEHVGLRSGGTYSYDPGE
jgi:hypothetical protein